MSFDTKLYDPDRIVLAFAGFLMSRGPGASGYADGEFARLAQNAESFVAVEGTDGTVTRSKTNRRLTTFTLRTGQSNSLTNSFLSSMLQLDETAPNGAGIGTFQLQDLSGTTFFSAQFAWVTKPPDASFDREMKEREWIFHVVRDVNLVGGN